jgi:hypothetical protein
MSDITPAASGGELVSFSYGDMAGAGFENMGADDQVVPFVRMLQALSPEVAKKSERIEGARAGMFINTATRDVFEDFVFVPVSTRQVYVEWRDREKGGGVVAQHEVSSPVVREARDRASRFNDLRTADGNTLVQTYYVAGLMLEDADDCDGTPVMLAFTSSAIKAYKQGIGGLLKFSRSAPLFAHRLRISSTEMENDRGAWNTWAIGPVNPVAGNWRAGTSASLIDPSGPQGALLQAASEFLASYQSGEVKAADEAPRASASDDDEESF